MHGRVSVALQEGPAQQALERMHTESSLLLPTPACLAEGRRPSVVVVVSSSAATVGGSGGWSMVAQLSSALAQQLLVTHAGSWQTGSMQR